MANHPQVNNYPVYSKDGSLVSRGCQTTECEAVVEDTEYAITQEHRGVVEGLQRRHKMLSDLNFHEQERCEKYKILYERELAGHRISQQRLTRLKQELANSESEYRRLCDAKRLELQNLKKQLEAEIDAMKKRNEEEIKTKESQIQAMKQTISKTFTGNSWQRQQFIEELSNEIKQLHQEAHNLRKVKKQLVSSYPDMKMCCKTTSLKTQQLDKQIQMRKGQVSILETRLFSKEANA